MKNFLIRISYLLPILVCIVIFNFMVDPARLFKAQDYERKMADAMISGSAVTNLENTNFNDRAMAKFMIQSLKSKKDIGVLGSSRVMTISSELFPGKTLLNNGLSSATLEDYISLYEIYREEHMLPATVIIGVDPWIFNKNNGLSKWRQFDQYYYSKFINSSSQHSFDLKISPQDLVPYEYQQLISISYFQAGIQSLLSRKEHLFDKQWFTLTNNKWNDQTTYLPDGTRTWPKNEREAPPLEVKKKVVAENNQPNNLVSFVELDQGLKQRFIKLIKAMKDDGIKVILFLPPYHPLAYDHYVHSNNVNIIKDVETFIRNTARSYDLTLVGSYNPNALLIPEASFSDSMHLRDDTELKRIFLNVTG